MKRIWDNHLELLKENYPVLCADELVKILPFTKSQIKTAASRHKLTKKGQLDSWNYADELKLIELYPDITNAKLGDMFGKTESAICGAAFKLRLFKSAEFKRKHAEKGMFKPGLIPPNKGKKQSEYMSPEGIERTKATRFKKGGISPHKAHFKDGDITLRHNHKERGEKPHYHIRISLRVWKELQIYNWEKINGPVPKGHILACIDGNTLNCDPTNWKLMTMADNARRNAGHVNLPDTWIAGILAKKGRQVDQDLKQVILENPELINAKRTHILINRKLNNHGKK